MKCPCEPCPSVEPMEVHHTDQYSTYYCMTCGFEDKVVWPMPTESPKRRERQEEPPRPLKKKLRR